MKKTRTPESEQTQRTRIRYASVVVALAAYVLKVVLADAELGHLSSLEHLADGILDAVVIAGIVTWFGESPWFKSYLEARLRHYASETADRIEALVAKSFLERAKNEPALRAYGREALQAIERSVQRASLPPDPRAEIDQLLKALNDMRDRVSIWRTDWREYLTWREVDSRPDLCILESELQMQFINSTSEPQMVPVAVSDTTLATLDDDAKLYKLTAVEFDNEPLALSAPTMAKENGRTTFTTTFPEQVVPPTPRNGSGTPFRQVTEMAYSRYEKRVFAFSLPVKGWELDFVHPAGLTAEVVVFGIGGPEGTDPLPPLLANPTHHHWKYSGWLLESSGVILTFSPPSK